jgi:maltose alpha-D-glucosyltransferase/alpha-amylase
VIVGFEGNVRHSASERRIKRSPLRDVAAMVRSIHYAAFSAIFGTEHGRGTLPGHIREEDRPALERWARFWFSWVSSRFASAYYAAIQCQGVLPTTPENCAALLQIFQLEKAISELGNELEQTRQWSELPMQGILSLMGVG